MVAHERSGTARPILKGGGLTRSGYGGGVG